MNMPKLRRTALCLALAAFAAPVLADPASERALTERVDRLARELEALKAELAQSKAAEAPAVAAAESTAAPDTVLTSYGEINLNIPTQQTDATQLDLRRFVLEPAAGAVTHLLYIRSGGVSGEPMPCGRCPALVGQRRRSGTDGHQCGAG